MANPRLTVLMPVYNTAAYLEQALDSILAQTFRDFVVLAINDGSTDDSEKILNEYAKRDSRVRVVNQVNMGVTRTLNKGVEMTETPFLARHDSDDFSAPDRFQKQVEFMEQNPDCALVGSSIACLHPDGRKSKIILRTEHEQICDNLLLGNGFVHGSILLRTSEFRAAGGYRDAEEARHIEDYDAWVRLACRARVANLPECLYTLRYHAGSVSSRYEHVQKNNAEALAARILEPELRGQIWAKERFKPERLPLLYSNDPFLEERRYLILHALMGAAQLLKTKGFRAEADLRLMAASSLDYSAALKAREEMYA